MFPQLVEYAKICWLDNSQGMKGLKWSMDSNETSNNSVSLESCCCGQEGESLKMIESLYILRLGLPSHLYIFLWCIETLKELLYNAHLTGDFFPFVLTKVKKKNSFLHYDPG